MLCGLLLRRIGRLASGSRRSGRLPAQFSQAAGADFDHAQVILGHIPRPDDVRGDGEYNFIFPAFFIFLRKQVFEDGKSADPGISA